MRSALSQLSRFSIQSALVVIAVVALVTFLVGPDLLRSHREAPAIADISKAGGRIIYRHEVDENTKWLIQNPKPPGNGIVRYFFGDHIHAHADAVIFASGRDSDLLPLADLGTVRDISLSGAGFTDGSIPSLLRISTLTHVTLSDTAISPEGLRRLSLAPNLKSLQMVGPWLTDDHAASISHFQALKHLSFVSTSISDKSMQHISAMKSIHSLAINYAAISDAIIHDIAKMNQLQHLDLRITRVSKQGVATIKSGNPELEVRASDRHFTGEEDIITIR